MLRTFIVAALSAAVTTPTVAANASTAATAVITENLTGIISGPQTIDTKGYFGPAGANLSGAKVAVFLQYVPQLLGPSQACRTHTCTYNASQSMADTPGSVLVTITINGHRVVYSPTYRGVVYFATQAPYQLTIDADASSGFGVGLPGVQLAALFKSAPVFGRPLSPNDQPVLQASPSNYVSFYDATSQTPIEQLTYKPTGGTK